MRFFLPKKMGQFFFCFFCLAFLCVAASAENDNTKLNGVLNQITSVKIDITKKEQQQLSVKQQLNNLKKKVDALTANLGETTKNLRRQKKALLKLTKDQARQQIRLKEAQDKLSSQINLANQIEQSSYFKVFFGEEKKITPSLMLVYHRYIFMARLKQMRDLKKTLERLEKNKREIKQQTQQLEKSEKKQEQQKQDLELAKKEHNQILDSLKNRIAEQNKKLKQLLIAKRNLERLVNTLTPRKYAMSSELKARFCRNFVWPTKGEITTHFGSPIEQSSWKWGGVIISAAIDQEIRAISRGKVVYADWLTGYGLLLIIDHGSGYMSLYGHNSSFRKKVNAVVEAGDVVATVGKSGSEEPELYFAIRYNGKPMDPERWCR